MRTHRWLWAMLLVYCIGVAQDAAAVPWWHVKPQAPVDLSRPPYAKDTYRVGLALSGGGTRSAMFTIGVLDALRSEGILDRVDVISSVSGGGYAAYWYLSKRAEGIGDAALFADCSPVWWGYAPGDTKTTKTLHDLLAHDAQPPCNHNKHWSSGDPYRFQYYLARNADLFALKAATIDGDPQAKPIANVVNEGLFHGRLVDLYEQGIFRAYGQTPEPRATYDAEAPTIVYSDDQPAPRGIEWQQLANALPDVEWVTSVTDARVDRNKKVALHLSMEIGTRGWGNAEPDVGYTTGPTDARAVLTTVRLSAAFIDRNASIKDTPGGALGHVAISLLKRPFGEDVSLRSNPSLTRHLSDGGQSENLGLLPLIRRRVPEIIVVDAGYDREGVFDDLCHIRKGLANAQVTISLDSQVLEQVCDGGRAINLMQLHRRLFTGDITFHDGSGTVLKLYVIKLGWDQRAITDIYSHADKGQPFACGGKDQPSCLLVAFYGQNSSCGQKNGDQYMIFPQYPTMGSTVTSSTYMFWGLRELGKYLGSCLTIDAADRLGTCDLPGEPPAFYSRLKGRGPVTNPIRNTGQCEPREQPGTRRPHHHGRSPPTWPNPP